MFKAFVGLCLAGLLASGNAMGAEKRANNVILFVPDGLRAVTFDTEHVPNVSALRDG